MASPDIAPSQGTAVEVGIGRPLSAASLATFSSAFDALTPEGLNFVPRKIPGLSYITPEIMAALLSRSSAGIDPTRLGVFTNRLVAALCEKGALNETALEPIDMVVYGIDYQLKDRYADSFAAILRVLDCADGFYREGYLIAGERNAIRQGLRQEPSPIPSKPTRHRRNLKLGAVEGDLSLLTGGMMKSLREEFLKVVKLEPIGLITSK
jgi:hypothetical protein